ncbi:hypothetical protein V6N13_116637 [Hibiscus sabdariffa]
MVEGQALWNVRKVTQVFSAVDAQKILQCSIANTRVDVLRWSHHHSGQYITKTGHHWLGNRGKEVSHSSEIWQTIAKANVLPKIRIFGWSIVYKALPVGRKLQASCLGSRRCKMCEKETKTLLHALRECPTSQEFFTIIGLESKLPLGPFASGQQWLEEVFKEQVGPSESVVTSENGGRLCTTAR